MITVRALPRSFDAVHVRIVGENLFCDEWDYCEDRRGVACSGACEIEIEYRPWGKLKWRLLLCREHAGYIATQLHEAIELVDGGDILRTKKAGG